MAIRVSSVFGKLKIFIVSIKSSSHLLLKGLKEKGFVRKKATHERFANLFNLKNDVVQYISF